MPTSDPLRARCRSCRVALAFDQIATSEGACPSCGVMQVNDPEVAELISQEAGRAAALQQALLLSVDRLRRLGAQLEPRRQVRQALGVLDAADRVAYERSLLTEHLGTVLDEIKAWGRHCRRDRRAQGSGLAERLRAAGDWLTRYAELPGAADADKLADAVAKMRTAAGVIEGDRPIGWEQALNAVMDARRAIRGDPQPSGASTSSPAGVNRTHVLTAR